MRRPWFACEPVDARFFEAAPMRLAATFAIARPAAQVWADLTDDNPLRWCRILKSITWTSPRPFGVGTTRTASALGGANVLHERYFAWEEGRRQSFSVEESTTPLFRRFAEDYLVEPSGPDACVFTWVIAAEPRPALRHTTPVNARLLETLFTDTRRHYGAG